MVFADSLPVQAMPGDFLLKNEQAPLLIGRWVKQGLGRDVIPFHPPGIDLEQPNIKGFSLCLGLPDSLHGFFPVGRSKVLACHIDGQGIFSRFLPGNGLQQAGRRILGPHWQGEKNHDQYQRNDDLHVFCLVLCVERNVNKRPAGQDMERRGPTPSVLPSRYSTENQRQIHLTIRYDYICLCMS